MASRTPRFAAALVVAAAFGASAAAATTAGASASADTVRCGHIGFTPNSDDLATRIRATGVSCRKARGLVRRVRERHDFVSGPRRFRAGGYRCRVVTEEMGLAIGHYRCRAGATRVAWDKS